MLKKGSRLTWKDINFMFKKQQMIFWKDFSFFYIPQYQNRQHNQISINIPTKLHKRATKRNMLRRIIYDYIKQTWFENKKFKKWYYKIFVILNKKSLQNIQQKIETLNKKDIKDYITKTFWFSFNNINKKLWQS